MKENIYKMVGLAIEGDDSLTPAERAAILLVCKDPLPKPCNPEAQRVGERYLSSAEASQELGISKRTLQRWIADGTITARRVVGRRRIPLSEIRRLYGDDAGVVFCSFQPSTEVGRCNGKESLTAG